MSIYIFTRTYSNTFISMLCRGIFFENSLQDTIITKEKMIKKLTWQSGANVFNKDSVLL